MRVLVNNISDRPEEGRVRLLIEFGAEGERQYLGSYDGADPKFKSFSLEEELFMRLSDLAYKRYCDSTLYQIDMMGLIQALVEREQPLFFPVELGTAEFAPKIPSPLTIMWRRMRRPFYDWWSWWSLRYVRRHNLEMLRTHGTLFPETDDQTK